MAKGEQERGGTIERSSCSAEHPPKGQDTREVTLPSLLQKAPLADAVLELQRWAAKISYLWSSPSTPSIRIGHSGFFLCPPFPCVLWQVLQHMRTSVDGKLARKGSGARSRLTLNRAQLEVHTPPERQIRVLWAGIQPQVQRGTVLNWVLGIGHECTRREKRWSNAGPSRSVFGCVRSVCSFTDREQCIKLTSGSQDTLISPSVIAIAAVRPKPGLRSSNLGTVF